MNSNTIKVACSNCNLRELCMPMGLSDSEMQRIDDVVATRRKISRGETLFRNGDKFGALYAIRTGFFKTCVSAEDGRDQVTGFQMAGEIIGLDGIVSDHHTCDAVALEDAEVCVMTFDRIEELSRENIHDQLANRRVDDVTIQRFGGLASRTHQSIHSPLTDLVFDPQPEQHDCCYIARRLHNITSRHHDYSFESLSG